MLVESLGSWPAMHSKRCATSSADFPIGPAWSKLDAKQSHPIVKLDRKWVLSPVRPHKAAGWRIEPPVSVPVASGTRRAATAAAEPPDDPPRVRVKSQGLRVLPKKLFAGCGP